MTKCIKPTDPKVNSTVLVDWTLGNTCNYACNYCPTGLHNGSVPWMDFVSIKCFIQTLQTHYNSLGRTLELQISGGEPTVYPHFSKLLDYCNEQNIKVQIITNGSRTLNWWKNNADKLEFICFSLHSACHDWTNFLQVVDYVSGVKKTHVNVVMDLDNFDLQYSRAKELQKNSNISINLKPIRKDFSSELYDYNEDQLKLMNSFQHNGKPLSANLARRGQIINEQSTLLNQSHLLINKQNQYIDWQCYGGLEYIVIDQYGNIYTSQCRQNPLGNIQDAQISWPEHPQICRKKSCFCSSDLFLTKFSND